jgi:hypothetical protein
MKHFIILGSSFALLALLVACTPKEAPAPAEEPGPTEPEVAQPVPVPAGSPTQVFWGDTHLHSSIRRTPI